MTAMDKCHTVQPKAVNNSPSTFQEHFMNKHGCSEGRTQSDGDECPHTLLATPLPPRLWMRVTKWPRPTPRPKTASAAKPSAAPTRKPPRPKMASVVKPSAVPTRKPKKALAVATRKKTPLVALRNLDSRLKQSADSVHTTVCLAFADATPIQGDEHGAYNFQSSRSRLSP